MKDWPILTTIILLPLVGALLLAILRGSDEAAKRNARWIALWTTLITFGVSLVLVVQFDPSNSGFQFVEHRPWLSDTIILLRRRGRAFAALRDPHHLPHADLHPRELELDHRAREGIHDRVSAARNADDRRVLLRSTSCSSTCSSRAA